MLELPYVSRPMVGLQFGTGRGREGFVLFLVFIVMKFWDRFAVSIGVGDVYEGAGGILSSVIVLVSEVFALCAISEEVIL